MNSGEVVVRSIDTDLNIDYSALGHTTHLAARMQELSSPGSALMSSSTLRQVEGFVFVQSLGPVQAKGISQPVQAYSLVGATTARTRVQAGAARGLTPLVGRNAEIEIFNKLVERASAGRGQILAMIGEPGVGKSRLVHEFTRHRLPAGWLVLEAMSVSYGKATPYFPVIEMLRRYFGIGPGESSEDIQSRLMTHVLELDTGLKDVIPPILSLLGALSDQKTVDREWLTKLPEIRELIRRFNSMDPQQRRRHTLDALKRVCIRESQRQNLLLVFEDLHWIDHETQAFLDIMVDSIPMAHVMLLVNYRPEYDHEWSDKSYYTQIRVEPLQTRGAEELLTNLLGHNPDLAPLKQQLIKRTEGNPFFVEESIRSLVETGILTGEKGSYRPALKIDNLTIPSTVQNVVADRIDRLPPAEKHLLQTAAGIGVVIPLDLLQAVSELPDSELFRQLTHLTSAEFLYESSLFPILEYTFKHALTNEIAYGALLRDRKILLHARIVTALEHIRRDHLSDHIESISHHAYHGELWEKAVAYSWDSGVRAAQRSANQEAHTFFETGLRALEHLPQSRLTLQKAIDFRLALRTPLYYLNEFAELHQHLLEAESIAQRISDDQRLGRAFNFLSGYYGLMGEHNRSIEFGKRALDINRHDSELNIVTHYYLGLAYHHVGLFDESIASLRRAVSMTEGGRFQYERFGTAFVLSVVCRNWLAQGFAQLGRFKDAQALVEDALLLANQSGHASSLANAHVASGFINLLQGNIDRAINALEVSLDLCMSNNIQVLMPHINSSLGYCYALAGHIEKAGPLLDKADEQSKVTGRRAGWALRLTWLGHSSLLRRQITMAQDQAQRAIDLAREAGERAFEAWAWKLMGDVNQEIAVNRTEALDHYATSLSLATELKMLVLKAHIDLSLGRFSSRENAAAEAFTKISESLKCYREMDMPFWLAAAEQELRVVANSPTIR
jgi:tetratricopeptide (TPR) repeat protein